MASLGVKELVKHEKYLGLPHHDRKIEEGDFCLFERLYLEKIQGWKEKMRSRPEK